MAGIIVGALIGILLITALISFFYREWLFNRALKESQKATKPVELKSKVVVKK